jgi:NAD(P)H-hydrate epimerase
VAALDAAASQSGVGVVQLMEVAGWQVARCAWRLLQRRPRAVGVVAGRGNNGGDGMVAARHLATWGCEVHAVVVAASEADLREPLASHVVSARACGVDVVVSSEPSAVRRVVGGAVVVLDALLGTGLRGAPRQPDTAAIVAMDGASVLAVDVPSGLDATSGSPYQPCVRARATCTLTAMKRGLWTAPARAQAGTMYVADIGMPLSAWRGAGLEPPVGVRGGGLVRLG